MSLYIKLIDNPTGQIVKPMETFNWGGNSWSAAPVKKILVKIHDVGQDIWIDPDEYKTNDYYFFSQRFSGSADKVYELYHPRYPKKRITVSPGGSTRYAARSPSGQTMNVPGGNRMEIRLDPHHLIQFNGSDRFAYGANLAWLDGAYGHDIGRNYVSGYSPTLNPQSRNYNVHLGNLDDYFRKLRNDFHCRVVRFWVFEGGEGLDFSGGQVHMDPAMAGNIQTILSKAQQYGLYIYWSLLSSHPVHNSAAFLKDEQIMRSARNPRTSPFLNQALQSFCNSISGSSHNFAIDVVNEAEKYVVRGSVSWGEIQKYISECCRKIKDYLGQSFLVSCGSAGRGWVNTPVEQTLRNYIGLGLDFYDYHIYNDTGELPKSFDELYGALRLDKPCIIGEFGQDQNGFLDDFQKGIAKNFLEQSWHLGYGGCLIWNYNFKNFSYAKRNTNYRNSLIYRNGSPRPVKIPIADFGTSYSTYTNL